MIALVNGVRVHLTGKELVKLTGRRRRRRLPAPEIHIPTTPEEIEEARRAFHARCQAGPKKRRRGRS